MRLMLIALFALLTAGPAVAQNRRVAKFSVKEFAAARKDPKRYTIDPASIQIENLGKLQSAKSVQPLPGPGKPLPPVPGLPGSRTPAGKDPLVQIDRIINIAKKVWQFIVDNKPVVETQTSYANAVPKGIEHWGDLQEWSEPEGTLYGFYAKNGYGVKVINVHYMVLRTHSGNYKGKGKYLNGVSVQPLSVDVSWGYRFNMTAAAPSVSNIGTSEDPVASMILNLKWSIDTVLKHSEGTSVYHVKGDGGFREIGGPFKNKSLDKTKKKIKDLSKSLPRLGAALRPEALRNGAAIAW